MPVIQYPHGVSNAPPDFMADAMDNLDLQQLDVNANGAQRPANWAERYQSCACVSGILCFTAAGFAFSGLCLAGLLHAGPLNVESGCPHAPQPPIGWFPPSPGQGVSPGLSNATEALLTTEEDPCAGYETRLRANLIAGVVMATGFSVLSGLFGVCALKWPKSRS